MQVHARILARISVGVYVYLSLPCAPAVTPTVVAASRMRALLHSAYAYERVAHVNMHTPTVHTPVRQYQATCA